MPNIRAVLSLVNLAATPNNKLDDQFLSLLAIHITRDYPDITIKQLEDTILAGIKGKFNDESYVPINSITIFRWLDKTIPAYKKQLKAYGI